MTAVFDDCYLCDWITREPTGNGRSLRWCGAARPEFETGDSCPTRLEKVEILISSREHEILYDSVMNGPSLIRPVWEWLRMNCPNYKVERFHSEDSILYLLLTFPDATQAIHFKMRWL